MKYYKLVLFSSVLTPILMGVCALFEYQSEGKKGTLFWLGVSSLPFCIVFAVMAIKEWRKYKRKFNP